MYNFLTGLIFAVIKRMLLDFEKAFLSLRNHITSELQVKRTNTEMFQWIVYWKKSYIFQEIQATHVYQELQIFVGIVAESSP